MRQLIDEELTGSIIGAFFEVYNALGFGFLEHIYKMALERELIARGHHVAREVGVRVMYKGEELSHQRLDMIVDGKVVVEVKSTLDLHKAARRQVYNYLKATSLEVGLLLHFGPKATFYREVRSPPKKDPPNPLNPPNPFEPSVIDPESAPEQPPPGGNSRNMALSDVTRGISSETARATYSQSQLEIALPRQGPGVRISYPMNAALPTLTDGHQHERRH